MPIDVKTIKRLKELTGVGITDAKKALEETKGDFDKALEAMRVKGLAKADKKRERTTKAGLIESYVHDGRIGVLVEVNCETDFVARTDDFKELAHDLAIHIAASAPRFISSQNVNEEELEKERHLIKEELKNSGKPENMLDKIVEGKINKFYSEVCLLNQPFVKNPDQTVEDRLKEAIARLGENIIVSQMAYLELGASN
ncbi:elongation factor Ts [Candidatus Saccharibacteria bacterium CPR2]|nr:elongation factor Ts [Candidatus Saccharibacteria bacterium CPR2]